MRISCEGPWLDHGITSMPNVGNSYLKQSLRGVLVGPWMARLDSSKDLRGPSSGSSPSCYQTPCNVIADQGVYNTTARPALQDRFQQVFNEWSLACCASQEVLGPSIPSSTVNSCLELEFIFSL